MTDNTQETTEKKESAAQTGVYDAMLKNRQCLPGEVMSEQVSGAPEDWVHGALASLARAHPDAVLIRMQVKVTITSGKMLHAIVPPAAKKPARKEVQS